MMAKDPAILFYTSDWLTGTMTLSWEDKGKYIHLLASMHQHGRLTEETIWLLVGSVSVSLKSKFKIDEEGRWYNERLELEARKRADYEQSRRINGSKGGRPKGGKNNHMQNHMVIHMPNHMGNHTDNDNVNVFKEGVIGGEQYPIESCKDFALKDSRWVTKNRITVEKLTEFNDFLERGGIFHKNPNEYKQHYRNWTAKKPAVVETKPIKNKLDELKARYESST